MPRRKPMRDLTMQEQLARGPIDLPFLMLVLLLLGIGLIMMFSASYASALYDSSQSVRNNPLYYITRQGLYTALGLAAMYFVSKIDYQTFRYLSIPLLGISIVLLILVIPFGFGRSTVGAQRWMRMFVVAGPSYQPSEIAKIAVILFFSSRLAWCPTAWSSSSFWDLCTWSPTCRA